MTLIRKDKLTIPNQRVAGCWSPSGNKEILQWYSSQNHVPSGSYYRVSILRTKRIKIVLKAEQAASNINYLPATVVM
ncbi:hypothetical protein U9R62_06890 [Cylindrospermopsis raciborskii DSH]